MHFLFITQYFNPEFGAASERITGQVRYLEKMGHKVTVITGFPNYPSGKIYPGYRKSIFKVQRNKNITIIRVWLLTTIENGALKRLFNYLSFMATSFLAGIFIKRPDFIIATSGPIFVGIVGCLLGMIKKKPFYFDVRDIWPERIYAGVEIKRNLLFMLLEKIEILLYRKSRKIFAVTKGVKKNIISKEINPEKIIEITNGVDTNIIIKKKVDRKKLGKIGVKNKDFIILYAGTLGLLQDINLMIDCAYYFKDYKDIIFLLVGNGVKKNEIISKVKLHNLKNVRMLDAMPQNKLSVYINLADIGINTNTNHDHNLMAIPVKMFAYMACEKPVVLANAGEISKMVEKYNFGKCVPPGDLELFCNAIMEFYNNKQLRTMCGRNGYKLVLEKFSSERLAQKLINNL